MHICIYVHMYICIYVNRSRRGGGVAALLRFWIMKNKRETRKCKQGRHDSLYILSLQFVPSLLDVGPTAIKPPGRC